MGKLADWGLKSEILTGLTGFTRFGDVGEELSSYAKAAEDKEVEEDGRVEVEKMEKSWRRIES